MKLRLTALIGPAIGLVLAVALLYPPADPVTLAVQGTSALLTAELEDLGALADEASLDPARPLGERVPERRWLFVELDRLARATGHGSAAPGAGAAPGAEGAPAALDVALEVAGVPAGESGLRRAVGSSVNSYDARAAQLGMAPVRIVDPGEAAAARLRLELQRDGPLLSLAARLEHPAAAPVAFALGDAEGEVRTWHAPGRVSVLPPLIAIVVALLLRRTVLSLFIGVWVGAALVVAGEGTSALLAPFVGLWEIVHTYLWNELRDEFRIEIIGFVVALVAMVGIMSRSGGVHGLIERLLGLARGVRSTLAVTWGMGLVIFFDDYANCLLVGNTMRPLTDRMRISREKLAYLVDSTAAPIAGLSLLSTWIAFEVSTYEAQLPAAGIHDSAYSVFLQTIPFRYYCLFTLLFVGLTIVLGRDFGPMLRAEVRARTTGLLVRKGGTPTVSEEMTRIEPRPGMKQDWRDAVLPISCVLVVTMASIFVAGGGPALWAQDRARLLSIEGATTVLFAGSGGAPIFIGATAGLVLAVFLVGSIVTRIAVAVGLVAAWELAPLLAAAIAGGEVADDPLSRRLAALLPSEPLLALGPGGRAIVGYLSYGAVFALGVLAVNALLGGRGRDGRGRLPGARPGRTYLPWPEIRRAGLTSIRSLLFAVIILFEAWMIGEVCSDLHTADYLVALLSGSVSAELLPVLLFSVACVVAFATGSSWSTMSILLPNVVALAAAVGVDAGMGALAMVVMCIGAILEGSIFGDHCSPISDTTVLSSVASAADHMDHVRTQAPYAVTTALAAVAFGYLPSVILGWWSLPLALLCAAVAMIAVLLFVGRRTPDPVPPAAHPPSASTRSSSPRAPAELAS